jgi:hypothetical protein
MAKTVIEVDVGQIVREVKRVSDAVARALVASSKWKYCPKSVYKEAKASDQDTQDAVSIGWE